jgi:hypothetical protein
VHKPEESKDDPSSVLAVLPAVNVNKWWGQQFGNVKNLSFNI